MHTKDQDRSALLEVRDVAVEYGRGSHALGGVTLDVPTAGIVALLGANGAGKTSLLRAITGTLGAYSGRVVGGTVTYDGQSIGGRSCTRIVRLGVSQVLEGRRVFASLTVDENLRAGGHTRRSADVRARLVDMYEMFPRLAERRDAVAGYLSGGEQQMLALGRALMQSPRLLLLDEPSLGLAPQVIAQIRDAIRAIAGAGTAVLLVEQNAAMALELADHGYVLQSGRVARHGSGRELLGDAEVQRLYLGLGGGGRARRRQSVLEGVA